MRITISGWHNRAKEEVEKEGIPVGDRIFDFLIISTSLIALYILTQHEIQSSGFYSDNFNTLDKVMLYGFWITWIITACLQGVLSQKLLSRMFDVFGGILFLLISTVYLLIKFPFEFSHFTDALPDSLSFLESIITNDTARASMGVFAVLMLFALVYSPIAYKFVKIKKGWITN